MSKKIDWTQIIVGVVIGLILGIGSAVFIQEGRIAKLEAQLEELKGKTKENVASVQPSPKVTEATQPAATILAKNTELTNAAWNAFKKLDFQTSIAKAEECIVMFEVEALQMQTDYSKKSLPSPPLGKVTEKIKEEVLSRGVLNDVATCYFIKGQALEKLSRIEDATQAYKKTLKFPDARAWDDAGFFWSPAVGATNNLSRLK